MTRRSFGELMTMGAIASVYSTACSRGTAEQSPRATLDARPPKTRPPLPAAGDTPLGLSPGRDGVLHIPPGAQAPLPLLVLLHGAGGSGSGQLRRLIRAVDEVGVAVLAPDSRGDSWDAIRTGFGPDVRFLDRALARVFAAVPIDAARIAIGGFSDGASYALSLGLQNGSLFRRILAFSPGFVIDGPPQGKPAVYISHGTADDILPIARCSRVIVPALERRGYAVQYREFEGGHAVPPAIAQEGLKWAATPS